MISCLESFIGLIGVQDNPTSGRFVNDIAGVTTQRVDESYEEDDIYEPLEAWQAIERTAIKRFEQRIITWAKRFFLNYSYLGTTITGQYRKKEPIANTNEYVGVLFDYDFVTFKALSIQVPHIYLWSDSIVTTTIRVYNASTGQLIESKEVDLVEGDNKIYTGWEFPVWRYAKVFITYDASEVSTIKQDPFGFNTGANLQFKKVSKSDDVLSDNLESTGNTNGLLVEYSVNCSVDNFVCQRLQLFEEAYIYCLAAEVLRQSIHSEEMNRYTLLDVEDAQGLIIQYDLKFNEMIEENLRGLTIDDDGICFMCNRPVNFREMLP